ncbi:hypothetical protein BGC07_11430 [Piscirickettsia litoralis]|uniref:Uncharacterized protein n=1 Tax=Piscirickettsia litoralis TaxID=1891921 RepID=A0ABX3A3G6_9GAMM|nr:hypothetical protein BGC07_11430 [Piscirickettsia litoralis]
MSVKTLPLLDSLPALKHESIWAGYSQDMGRVFKLSQKYPVAFTQYAVGKRELWAKGEVDYDALGNLYV